MPIAIVLTLLPTLGFYFYVLVQFMKEASRRRNHDTCALIVPLHAESARQANYSVREFRSKQIREPRNSQVVSAEPPTAERESEDVDSIRAKVIVTQPKNRLAAYSPGAERMAVKHAAKG